jgi:hypothetical protein
VAEHQPDHTDFDVEQDHGLIGVPLATGAQDATRYFAEETAADTAVSPSSTDEALAVAGAWSDLSWEDMERDLDRIRHDSQPSLPIGG